MTEDRASRAVLVSEARVRVANEHAASVDMLYVEDVIAHDLLAFRLGVPIAVVFVADELPVVAIVPVAVITEARHLLTVADRCIEVCVRVQVFARGIVLEAYMVAALDAFACKASFLVSLSIPHNPQ